MAHTDPRTQGAEERHPSPPRARRFRLTSAWIALALVAILSVAQVVGGLVHNLNQTRMGAIFAIGVVSFLGILSLHRQGERFRPFESSEVRTALTTSFAMVFFAAVAIFLFSTNSVGDFGRTLMSNLTSLFGVVIGFYFASSAVVEYGKIRNRTATGEAARPGTTDPERAALEAKIEELQAMVARLAEASAVPDGHGEGKAAGAEPVPARGD